MVHSTEDPTSGPYQPYCSPHRNHIFTFCLLREELYRQDGQQINLQSIGHLCPFPFAKVRIAFRFALLCLSNSGNGFALLLGKLCRVVLGALQEHIVCSPRCLLPDRLAFRLALLCLSNPGNGLALLLGELCRVVLGALQEHIFCSPLCLLLARLALLCLSNP